MDFCGFKWDRGGGGSAERGQWHVEMHAECDYNNKNSTSTDGATRTADPLTPSPTPCFRCHAPFSSPQFGCVALVIIYSSIAEECGASCGVSGEKNSSVTPSLSPTPSKFPSKTPSKPLPNPFQNPSF